MKLSASCKDAFSSTDRQRGNLRFELERVSVLSVGMEGAFGIAAGSQQQSYRVAVDFRDVSDGALGAFCECPRFAEGDACKHIWAFLRELDTRTAGFIATSESLALETCTIADVSIGELIESEITPPKEKTPEDPPSTNAATASDSSSTKPAPERPPGEAPQWRKSLAALAAARNRTPIKTDQGLPTADKQTRRWIAIRLGQLASGGRFSPIIFTSKRKTDGEWGTPRALAYDAKEMASISDDVERKAIALLKSEPVYQRGYRATDGKVSLSFRDELLHETLSALCATGRFVWTLDSTSSLVDYHAITYSGPQPWSFELQVTEVAPGQVSVDAILHRTPLLENENEQGTASPQQRPREQRSLDHVVSVCESGAVLFNDEIGILAPESIHWAKAWQRQSSLHLSTSELNEFMQELLKIDHPPAIQLQESLGIETVNVQPIGLLRLAAQETTKMFLTANVAWRYGEEIVPIANKSTSSWDSANQRLIQRDQAAESKMLQELAQMPIHEHFDHYYQTQELRLHRKHLNETVLFLTEKNWDVEADGLRMIRPGNFNISVESGEDWFDVHADVEYGERTAALPTLIEALRKGERYVKLDDGSQGLLPESWLDKFDSLLRAGKSEGDAIRFGTNQALMLDMLLAEQDVKFDRKFSTWCKKINAFAGVKPGKQPRSFHGELREYQKDALGWFKFLNEFDFGGCLADDMGLGKTVQILALLESRRVRRLKAGEERKPSLVVVPKSLVFNWLDETARFTPKMKVVDYTGGDRNARWDDTATCDLVVTTYSTMRLDIQKLIKRDFDYVVLDEAQAIKNPSAQATKAARLLKSDYRLAMTGTPVENHLGDLWSLFDFLNPGMLGSTTASNFTGQENPHQRISALNNALKPFILRRTKQQVLTELPEKSEQTLVCEMLPAQKKLYNELRDHYRASLTKKIKTDGMKRSKFQVLEALLRLRQTACDPRLVSPKEKSGGAKTEMLMQHLLELQDEGHKVLVFSQFTSLLALVRQQLVKADLQHEYLDGKTTKRAECVKRFQEDDNCRVFLISLKAGGHGLNLTAASYVFILDPWWNPAVEAQAIDRAHRMGQTNPVTAYRLIARDTVEDKIIKLQQSKRELADAIVTADPSLISGLSISDLRLLFE
ncbi:MAG: hypothetical protein Aurels2KO_37500 [Aureliella sp.]